MSLCCRSAFGRTGCVATSPTEQLSTFPFLGSLEYYSVKVASHPWSGPYAPSFRQVSGGQYQHVINVIILGPSTPVGGTTIARLTPGVEPLNI